MCDICNNSYPLGVALVDYNRRIHICHNCMYSMLVKGRLKFTPDPNLVCEVTGESGAVRYMSRYEDYTLKPTIMLRLINHSLHKSEFKALIKTRDKVPFELHDDFYSDDGACAYQPYISNVKLRKIYSIKEE